MSTSFASAAPGTQHEENQVSPVSRIIAGWIDLFIVGLLAVPAMIGEIIALGNRGEPLGVMYFALWAVTILAWIIYAVTLLSMLAKKGSSPGTSLFKYRVVNHEKPDEYPGYGKAAIRLTVGAVSWLLCCGLGTLILAVTIALAKDGRGLHDKIAGTAAVKRRSTPSQTANDAAGDAPARPFGFDVSATGANAGSQDSAAATAWESSSSAHGTASPAAIPYEWEASGSPSQSEEISQQSQPWQQHSGEAWQQTVPAQWEPNADVPSTTPGANSGAVSDAKEPSSADAEGSQVPVHGVNEAVEMQGEPAAPETALGNKDASSHCWYEASRTEVASDDVGNVPEVHTDPERTEFISPVSHAESIENEDAPTVMRPAVVAAQGFTLEFEDGTTLELEGGETSVIGRNPQAREGEQALSFLDETRSMSKTHAFIDVRGDQISVQDAGSTNGTAVVHADGSETSVSTTESVTIEPGAKLRFGDRVATIKERRA